MSDFYKLSPAEQAERLTKLAQESLCNWDIGDNPQLLLLKHRENAVFKVTTGNGDRYALRVHRHGYHSDADLHSELEWMAALNRRGLLTPMAIPSKRGELFVVQRSESVPDARQCDLITWVDGEPLGSIEEGVDGDLKQLVESYRVVGELAARVHKESNAWDLPVGFSRQVWDEEGLLGDKALWGCFWELDALTNKQQILLLQARQIALQKLQSFGKAPDRYGLIHGDFLPENLLKSADGFCLIDFDDSGFGWHLFEFATSLFFHLGEPHFDDTCQAMIEGYRSIRDLPDEHLELLPTFFLVRGLVYLGWAHTRKETETAKEMTPMMIEAVTEMATAYLQEHSGDNAA